MNRKPSTLRLHFMATLGATCGSAAFLTFLILGGRPMATFVWFTCGFVADLGSYLFGDYFRVFALVAVYWAMLGALVAVGLDWAIRKWRGGGNDGQSDEPARPVSPPRGGALFAALKTHYVGMCLIAVGFLAAMASGLYGAVWTCLTGMRGLSWTADTLIVVAGYLMAMTGVLFLNKSMGIRYQLALGLTVLFVLSLAAAAVVGVALNGPPHVH